MNKISFMLDYFFDNIEERLKELNGIKSVEINNEDLELLVEYNDDITLDTLLDEIYNNITFIKGFKKNVDEECIDYKLLVDDLCCEYCYMNALIDLINNDAIVSISCDFGYDEKDGYDTFFNANVVVKIIKSKYTKELEEEIKKAFE